MWLMLRHHVETRFLGKSGQDQNEVPAGSISGQGGEGDDMRGRKRDGGGGGHGC
jgi:hypothetical protein